MSHNISSSDIHIVPVDGCEKKNLKSVTIEKEDGLTKMSWVTEINVTELERRSKNEPKIFVAKSFLLLGKFYSPYILFVFFSRLKTGHFRYYASVAICPFIEQLLEDQNNQEQSSTKKGSKHKPLCGIWISANQAEKIPFDIRLLEQDEIWLPITHYSYQLEPHQTYEFSFQLWFKLIDQSAPLAMRRMLSSSFPLCSLTRHFVTLNFVSKMARVLVDTKAFWQLEAKYLLQCSSTKCKKQRRAKSSSPTFNRIFSEICSFSSIRANWKLR